MSIPVSARLPPAAAPGRCFSARYGGMPGDAWTALWFLPPDAREAGLLLECGRRQAGRLQNCEFPVDRRLPSASPGAMKAAPASS